MTPFIPRAAVPRLLVLIAASLLLVACEGVFQSPDEPDDPAWQTVADRWPGAALAVEGTGPEDVWIAGARADERVVLRHWDGQSWTDTTIEAPEVDLWAVHPFDRQTAMVAGGDGAVFRVDGAAIERMATPGMARETVYALAGTSPEDVYAVGGSGATDGFVWHHDGSGWREMRLPADMPKHPNTATAALYDVTTTEDGTIWAVGARGAVLKKAPDAEAFERVTIAHDGPLHAVDARGPRVVAVGGDEEASVVTLSPNRRVRTLGLERPLRGLSLGTSDDHAVAVGRRGQYAVVEDGRWVADETRAAEVDTLQSVWVDREGTAWTVGGEIGPASLEDGLIAHRGPTTIPPPEAPNVEEEGTSETCPDAVVERARDESIARRWIEQILAAIRVARPAPTVHSRNLYHLSLAMFEVWATFDTRQDPVLLETSYDGPESEAARRKAISFAAYRLLTKRYASSPSAATTENCLARVMQDLGYDVEQTGTDGDTPTALGNRVAGKVLRRFRDDGSGDSSYYRERRYQNPNPPLSVGMPGAHGANPTIWQPLEVPVSETQSGTTIERWMRGYLGPDWGGVETFAMERPSEGAPYVDHASFPSLGDQMDRWVMEVVRKTHRLSAADAPLMDISPRSYGNNDLASDAGTGHPVNPATGRPYDKQPVPESDVGRVLAEYWADGPASETPPGHWNTIAHKAVDAPSFEAKLAGTGPAVDPLTWDVHMYLLLNGAVHDAAVVAWELKRLYESARPITLIRWMAGQGQSSDPSKPAYDVHGLPLAEGLVEVVTPESSAPGKRHAHLAPYVGEIAINSWPGTPSNAEENVASARWIRGVEWIPYQSRTFVTPAFPGYVSGHSTFSRAAARVLHRLTGSKFFPGGMAEFVAPQGEFLTFEDGPSRDVHLQWATYYDAADQASQSRVWGGIHIKPDDYDGRIAGQQVGDTVWQWALQNLERLSDERRADGG